MVVKTQQNLWAATKATHRGNSMPENSIRKEERPKIGDLTFYLIPTVTKAQQIT